jgi:hypothetical protein
MAGEHPEYLNWIRQLPCHFCGAQPPSHPHHHTRGMAQRRGKGERAHDHQAMPLCWKCHRRFHDAAGPFAAWNKTQRIAWQDSAVTEYRNRYTDEEVF